MLFLTRPTIIIDGNHNNRFARILGVYTHTNYMQRRVFWMDLIQLLSYTILWAIIEDFNVVLELMKKDGPLPSHFL